MDDPKVSAFNGYTPFGKPALKLTARGRRSGGVVCLIKNELCLYIKPIDVDSDYFCAFIVDKSVTGTSKDVMYICGYIPPEGSPYYKFNTVENGVALLEEFICDCLLFIKNDAFVLVSGDFNSRISNISNDFETTMCTFDDLYLSGPLNHNRNSEDTELNNYGKLLLNMCHALRLCVLNGMCDGDLQGRYTYISEKGSSVNDYFLMSFELFDELSENCKLFVSDQIHSDHMPLELRIIVSSDSLSHVQENNSAHMVEKFIWNDDYHDTFFDMINSQEIQFDIEKAMTLIDVDINEALNIFNFCLKKAAECMKKQINIGKRGKVDDWYDMECRISRRNVRKLLNNYRRTLSAASRESFCKARREYKNLLKKKKKDFNDSLIGSLIDSISSQREFWNIIHKRIQNRKQQMNNISKDVWFQYFTELLEKM